MFRAAAKKPGRSDYNGTHGSKVMQNMANTIPVRAY